ncbi:MAG: pentapeptide repeat-containing protein, partial [Rhodocyclaceae bacterium]|nr:pentapeptide repeat-containing protein [Rhodocyclaceae bacterium]
MTPEDALRAGNRVWTHWRAEHAGLPDLRGADLQRLDLCGFDLSRCNLHGANLSAAVLDDARLQHCDLVATR